MLTSALGAALLAVALLSTAQAQTVYRIVGPDGRVSFSDKPPVDAGQAKTLATGAAAAPDGATVDLPYALRRAVAKYPVTLYTAANCASCDEGRALLRSRGVPFTEKTIATAADIAAFQQINASNSVPVVTIGSQRVTGFSSADWASYLSAAGYPEKSVLPARYRQPPATGLAAVPATSPALPAAETQPKAPALPMPAAPRTSPDNPAGIQF